MGSGNDGGPDIPRERVVPPLKLLDCFNRQRRDSLWLQTWRQGTAHHGESSASEWTRPPRGWVTSAGAICGSPAAIRCSYRDTGVRCSVVGPLLWPARRPGTRYQTTCEIRHVPPTVFAGTWKLFFSRFASVHSALEALRLCATLICY